MKIDATTSHHYLSSCNIIKQEISLSLRGHDCFDIIFIRERELASLHKYHEAFMKNQEKEIYISR